MSTRSRDLLYGRQGGRWLPEGLDPLKPEPPEPAATCDRCGRPTHRTVRPYWRDQEWCPSCCVDVAGKLDASSRVAAEAWPPIPEVET